MPFPSNPASLTTGSNATNATSYVTASITPTAATAVFAAITVRRADPNEPTTPTVTGCNLTWTAVTAIYFDTATTRAKLFLFHGHAASPTSGAVTFDFGGITQSAGVWNIWEHQDVANPASPVVQSGVNSNSSTTNIAVSLPGAATAGNGIFGVCSSYGAATTLTPDAGWTEIAEAHNATIDLGVNAVWRGDIVDETPSWAVWSSSTFNGAIGFELAPGGAAQSEPIAHAVESDVALDVAVSQTFPEPLILVGLGF